MMANNRCSNCNADPIVCSECGQRVSIAKRVGHEARKVVAPFTVSQMTVVGAAAEIAELRGDLDPLVYDKASQIITLMVRSAGGEVTDE